MKHLYKRLFSALTGAALCGTLLTGLLPLGTLTASALDYGPLKYKDYGDHIEILSCEKDVTELVIPEEIDGVPVTVIGNYACFECKGLTKLSIPNSIETIGNSAFWKCSGLTGLHLGNHVTEIGYSAFYGCSQITAITIPSSVHMLGGSAFSGCSLLKTVTIENGVKEINIDAFRGCSSLEMIDIPDSVEEIGTNAFYYCTNLKAAKIGNGVKRIAMGAFNGCSALKEVTLGNSVERIESDAFAGSAITQIALPESVNYVAQRSFVCKDLVSVTIKNPNCQFATIGTVFWNEQDSNGNCYYNGVIYGYNGSTAQAYAKSNGCKFISLNNGDINCDGDTNLIDGVMLARIAAGFEQSDLTPEGRRRAELDGEEGLSNGDLVILLQILAGV